MPPRSDYNHAARKRTATLPQKLRTELEQLGHLPLNSNNPPKSRKQRRKDKRTQPKLNRKLAHEGPTAAAPAATSSSRKRRPDDSDSLPTPTSTAPSHNPPAKRTKLAHPPEPQAPHQLQQTPLERRLARQQGPDPASAASRRKDPAATDEDREIAWLEAKLGLQQQRGLTSAERGRMRSEFDEDGLGGASLAASAPNSQA